MTVVCLAALVVSGEAVAAKRIDPSICVLQIFDTPSAFHLKKNGPLRGVPNSWESEFEGRGSLGTVTLDSLAVVYSSTATAHAALVTYRAPRGFKLLLGKPGLVGSEERIYWYRTSGLDFYQVAWRSGRVKATLITVAPVVRDKTAALQVALTFAVKQQKDIARASR
jgi:hypothetical protein